MIDKYHDETVVSELDNVMAVLDYYSEEALIESEMESVEDYIDELKDEDVENAMVIVEDFVTLLSDIETVEDYIDKLHDLGVV